MPTTTTTYTVGAGIGAKIGVLNFRGGFTQPGGGPTAPVYPPATTTVSIRLESGGVWWQATVTLTITWTYTSSLALTGGGFRDFFTGTVASHTATETASGSLYPLAPGATVASPSTFEIFGQPDGETINVLPQSSSGRVWTNFEQYFVAPARLFPTGSTVTVTETNEDSFTAVGSTQFTLARLPQAVIGVSSSSVIRVFSGNSTAASVAGTYRRLIGATLASALWDWADGTTTPEMAPLSTSGAPITHEYDTEGTYLVTLGVVDNWGNSASATRSFTPIVDTGRLVSFVCDPLGFTIRAQTLGTPKACVIDRHNGLSWEVVNSDAILHKAALSKPRDLSRLYRIAQHQTAKDWRLHVSDDTASTWGSPIATPFDSSYKYVSRVAWASTGEGMAVGINASGALVAKVTVDGGVTWETNVPGIGAVVTPASGTFKSVDLEYNTRFGRYELQADGGVSRWTSNTMGTSTWSNL